MGFLNRLPARQDSYYARNRMWKNKGSDTAANRRTLVSPSHLLVNIGGAGNHAYELEAAVEMDLDTAANWDDSQYATAANRAGKDFYVYACVPSSGYTPDILLSAAVTYPSGYTANNSRKIGGFHCMPYVTAPTWLADKVTVANYVVQPVTPGATKLLYKCTARAGDFKTDATTEPTWPTTVGETVVDDQITWTCIANAPPNLPAGHTFELFAMGDIVPRSVWDQLFRPVCSPEGMVYTGLSDLDDYGGAPIWQDIYLGGTRTDGTSIHGAALMISTSWANTVLRGRAFGKRLLNQQEFSAGAHGCNIGTVIAGAASPGYSLANLDSAGRAMLSYCGCWGNAGIHMQWLDDHQPLILGIPDTGQLADHTADTTFGKIYGQGTNGATNAHLIAGGWYSSVPADTGPFCSTPQYSSYANAIVGMRFGCNPKESTPMQDSKFSNIGTLVLNATESSLKKVGSKYRLWVTYASHTKIALYEADAVAGPYTLIGDCTVGGSPVAGAFHNVHLIGETYYIVYSYGWDIYVGTLDATGLIITLLNDGNPVLTPDVGISWESSGNLANPSLAYDSGTWYLLYESWGATGARNQIGLASGSSLSALTRHASNPVIAGGYHRIRAGNPDIVVKDGYFAVVLGVWQDDYAEDSHIIRLKTTDFVNFTDEKFLRRGVIGHNQCDPSIYEEGDETYMTYYDNSPAGVYLSRGRIDL